MYTVPWGADVRFICQTSVFILQTKKLGKILSRELTSFSSSGFQDWTDSRIWFGLVSFSFETG